MLRLSHRHVRSGCIFEVLANGIEASFMERMALSQPFEPHPHAFCDAICLDGLDHVFRTGRMKTAGGRQHRRDPSSVHTQHRQRQCPHFSTIFPIPRSISTKGASSAARRGLITISHCAPNSLLWSRNASRILRLIRFRTTAFPNARGTVVPIRGPEESFRLRQKAANIGQVTRIPLSYTARKSADRRIREVRENPSLGFGRPDGSFVADRQFMPAPGAAPGKHCASILGLHARAESVRFGALSIIRLKCTFGHVLTSAADRRSPGAPVLSVG